MKKRYVSLLVSAIINQEKLFYYNYCREFANIRAIRIRFLEGDNTNHELPFSTEEGLYKNVYEIHNSKEDEFNFSFIESINEEILSDYSDSYYCLLRDCIQLYEKEESWRIGLLNFTHLNFLLRIFIQTQLKNIMLGEIYVFKYIPKSRCYNIPN